MQFWQAPPLAVGYKPVVHLEHTAFPDMTVHVIQFVINSLQVLQLCLSAVGYRELPLASLEQVKQFVPLMSNAHVEQYNTAIQVLQVPIIGERVLIFLHTVTPFCVTSHPFEHVGKMIEHVLQTGLVFPVGNNPEPHPVQVFPLHLTQLEPILEHNVVLKQDPWEQYPLDPQWSGQFSLLQKISKSVGQ